MTTALFLCPEGGGHLYPVSSAFLEAAFLEAVNDNSGLYKMICIELFHQELCECIATIVF